MTKKRVFISYAREDAKYLASLKDFINSKSIPNITVFDDGVIDLGVEWDDNIKKNLLEADIILLLISQYFQNSDYINQVELQTAMERHNLKKCKVIPLFISQCKLMNSPDIKKISGLPGDGTTFQNNWEKREELFFKLQEQIERFTVEQPVAPKCKIYLSIPQTEEGFNLRNSFEVNSGGKAKREPSKWKYSVIPCYEDAINIQENPKILQQSTESGIKEALYSIHIISDANSFYEGIEKQQFDIATKGLEQNADNVILWYVSQEIKEQCIKDIAEEKKERILKLPSIIGGNTSKIFEVVDDLDKKKREKEREVNPNYKGDVLLMYHTVDRENAYRIKLKTELEERPIIFFPRATDDLGTERDMREVIKSYKRVIIFYGNIGYQWFHFHQNMLVDALPTQRQINAICVDDPKKDTKIEIDVAKKVFRIMEHKNQIKSDIDNLLNTLGPQ